MNRYFSVFLTSFLLGGVLGFAGANLENDDLLKTSGVPSQTPLNLSEYWEVYDIVSDEYYSNETIDNQELVYGSIEGMVDALGDKHSEFMDPETTEKFEQALTGDFEGIGAVVEKHPLGVKVERILKGSPAKKYDVRADDIIIEANTTALDELDLYDAVEQIKGPADSKVVLKIIRPGEQQVLEKEVIREKIHIPSVEEEYFEDENIGYISLNMFGETTAKEFHKALENMKQSDVDGIIIDVRDNGGGYLQSSVEILSEFIPHGELLVQTRHRDEYFNQDYYSINTGNIYDKKIVVLVNGNSASASEITAGALREYNRAILVGEKTYGKGSVQQPFELEDGSILKLTIAKWFTPEGKNIDDEGIEPDIEVVFKDEDYENEYDRQLEEAKKILQLYEKTGAIGLTVEEYGNKNQSEELVPVQ